MNELPRIFLPTCSKYYPALRVFVYLLDKYWSGHPEVCVVGFRPPEFTLPDRFTFMSLGDDDWPKEKFSNQFVEFFNMVSDEYIIHAQSDYWLYRQVNVDAIERLYKYIQTNPNILRIDLTWNRMKCETATDCGVLDYIDLVSTPAGSPYQMSNQWAIWNVQLWKEFLRPNEFHEMELWGSYRLAERPDVLVLGTKQVPIRHVPAIDRGDSVNLRHIQQQDETELQRLGLLPL